MNDIMLNCAFRSPISGCNMGQKRFAYYGKPQDLNLSLLSPEGAYFGGGVGMEWGRLEQQGWRRSEFGIEAFKVRKHVLAAVARHGIGNVLVTKDESYGVELKTKGGGVMKSIWVKEKGAVHTTTTGPEGSLIIPFGNQRICKVTSRNDVPNGFEWLSNRMEDSDLTTLMTTLVSRFGRGNVLITDEAFDQEGTIIPKDVGVYIRNQPQHTE